MYHYITNSAVHFPPLIQYFLLYSDRHISVRARQKEQRAAAE